MKKKCLLITVVFSNFLGVLYCLAQAGSISYSDNSNTLKVSFVDTALSIETQAFIVADLQLCLNEWGKATKLKLIEDDPIYIAYLDNPVRCPHYPETLDFPENIILNSSGERALQVPKKLGDAYTNAFAFAAANSNIVAAAYQFVAFVNSGNFVNISPSELPNYILYKNVPTNIVVQIAPTLIADIGQKFSPPSILGFYYSPEGPASSNLWVRLPQSETIDGVVEWNTFPSAIWHDNRWKFCIWDHALEVP